MPLMPLNSPAGQTVQEVALDSELKVPGPHGAGPEVELGQ